MNITLRKTSLALITCLVLPALAFAGSPKGNTKPRPQFKPPYDVITSVDTTASTVTIGHVNSNNSTTKTLIVDSRTEIQVNGEKGTLADVKAGMKVSFSPGMDENRAERLVLSPPPPEPAASPSR